MSLKRFDKITLKVNGKPLKLSIEEEFGIQSDSLELVPVKFGYLVGLQFSLQKALYSARLERDKYFSVQFGILKNDYDGSRPPSDESVRQEIMEDEKYHERLREYYSAQSNYDLITGLVEAYKIRTEVLRTISANRRKEMD